MAWNCLPGPGKPQTIDILAIQMFSLIKKNEEKKQGLLLKHLCPFIKS